MTCEYDIKKWVCIGNTSGVIDSLILMSEDQKKILKTKPTLRVPNQGISNDQAIRIILKHIKLRPESMHLSARTGGVRV